MKLFKNPAQTFALVTGALLLAAGVVALGAGSTNFGTVADGAGQDLWIWQVSGWETIFYLAVGTLGLMAASRLGTARLFALAAGYVFVALAVYGFVDGNDIVSIFAVGTADKLSYLARSEPLMLIVGPVVDPRIGARPRLSRLPVGSPQFGECFHVYPPQRAVSPSLGFQ